MIKLVLSLQIGGFALSVIFLATHHTHLFPLAFGVHLAGDILAFIKGLP